MAHTVVYYWTDTTLENGDKYIEIDHDSQRFSIGNTQAHQGFNRYHNTRRLTKLEYIDVLERAMREKGYLEVDNFC